MAEKKLERRGLGRGLSALMADTLLTAAQDADPKAETFVSVSIIEPNPNQPRRSFDQTALDELAHSIREKGVIQPLIVRPHPVHSGQYEIVAGERRWRASQLAELTEVPVIIRRLNDTEVLEVAIIENIQRADLNSLEEALSYQQLMDRFGHTQERLAEALSKSRSHIANQLRLLQLPDEIQAYVRQGQLSAGHARAMITAADPVRIAMDTVAKGLSVREVERLVQKEKNPLKPSTAKQEKSSRGKKDTDTIALEADLTAALGLNVEIFMKSDQSGEIVVRYKNLEDLDRLCSKLGN